jgi:hypothetical protein
LEKEEKLKRKKIDEIDVEISLKHWWVSCVLWYICGLRRAFKYASSIKSLPTTDFGRLG